MTIVLGAVAPTSGRISSGYGWRQLGGQPDMHSGIDIAAPRGTPARSVLRGRVALVGAINGYGLSTVVVEHPDVELFSLYGHLDSAAVTPGQRVRQGQMIGRVGGDGWRPDNPTRTVPVHLHFEFLTRWPPSGRDQDRLNPMEVFARLGLSYDEASRTFTEQPPSETFLQHLLRPYPWTW